MRLLLVRHGQTPANVLGQLDTAIPGAGLTPRGFEQAGAIPVALSAERRDDSPASGVPADDLVGSARIGAICVSTLVRTQLTAQPLADSLGMTPGIFDGLREIAAGGIEMLSDRQSLGIYTSTTYAWAKGDLDLRMPGSQETGEGEDGHRFFARYDSAIDEIRSAGEELAIAFSHGAAIRTWVAARCVNTDGTFAGDHQLDNTGVAVLETDGERGWRLVRWHAAPIGGPFMADAAALDPIGETLDR